MTQTFKNNQYFLFQKLHHLRRSKTYTNTLESNDILIISNFLNTLLVLKNQSSKNEITLNIQVRLIQKKKIEFIWVPFHIGIVRSKKIDKCAIQVTKNYFKSYNKQHNH